MLDKNSNIAFIMSPLIGDALIAMVAVHNLYRNGHKVTVFSNYLHSLANWFPYVKVLPFPDETSVRTTLKQFSTIITSYRHNIIGQADQWHPQIIVFADYPAYKLQMSLIDIQLEICKNKLGLTNLTRNNGLQMPYRLVYKKYPHRIIIHPTSSQKLRTWRRKRFIKLAKWLQKDGFNPVFIVAPNEKQDWQCLLANDLNLYTNNSLDGPAQLIYESGLFVGNDSGLGHLASNLNIPTVTLILRPKMAKQWRPNWGPGIILLPPFWLITRPLKEKFWKYCISARKVYKAVRSMLA